MKLGSSRAAYVLSSAGFGSFGSSSLGCVYLGIVWCLSNKADPPPDKLKECKRNVRRQMLEPDVVAVPPKISVPILHAPSCNPLIPAQPVERQSASPSLYLLGPYYISTGMLRAGNKGPLT